jgi:hypothetical protein
LVAVDTKDNSRITWTDRGIFAQMSDVAVDTRGGGWSVITAAPFYDASDTSTTGVVQVLRPGSPQLMNGTWVVPADVTRYPVGGGAGSCYDTGVGAPCIPGVAVDRRRGQPIYFSEPDFVNADGSVGAVGELDTRPYKCPTNLNATCAKVRHWPLPSLTSAPREIRVDDLGRVWGITSSGHVFSLEIDRNCDKGKVTRHDPLIGGPEDLFAVAPDGGVIGFTDSNNDKVSVLFPQQTTLAVTPAISYVLPVKKTLFGERICLTPMTHDIAPRASIAVADRYTTPGDGTYVETNVAMTVSTSSTAGPSMTPTGMAPDGNHRTGAFFYGVSFALDANGSFSNRIGFMQVAVEKDRDLNCRRSDDDYDNDGIDNEHDDDVDGDGIANALDTDMDNDGVPDALDKDKNGDGIEDQYQSPGNRERQQKDSGQMAPGETREYDMVYDEHSILMLAIVESTDLTVPLAIDIVDPNGVVVLSTPAALGKAVATATPALAGVYTIRVKNAGLTSAAYTTRLIGRQVLY